jgi:hypothetical protein
VSDVDNVGIGSERLDNAFHDAHEWIDIAEIGYKRDNHARILPKRRGIEDQSM